MLSYTDATADDAALRVASPEVLTEAGRDAIRHSRQAEARAVLAAYRIGQHAYDQVMADLPRRQRIPDAPDKAAVGEVSLHLGVSKSKAARWIQLGEQLTDLDPTRLAYLSGELSTTRVRIIVDALAVLADAVRAQAESIALILAARPSADRVLRDQLAELVISLDPDAAADLRDEFAARHQDVQITDDAHGHAAIDACVPAELGVHLRKQIAALIAERVCRHDPRRVGEQRVAALAELHHLPGAHLTCDCGRPDCAVGATGVTGTTDGTPAAPVGEPQATRGEPQDNGQTAPTPEIPEPPEASAPSTTPSVGPDLTPTLPTPTQTALTVIIDPTGDTPPYLRGYGSLDPDHALALTGTGVAVAEPAATPPIPVWTSQTAWTNAPPVDPSGRGGHTSPPRGALLYRPSPRLRQKILSLDRTCRYPFCGKPAEDCHLDHLVPFDHHDPEVGGWTVDANLAPLCTPDHHRKHLGLWLPTMHTDRTITWRNPSTGRTLTTYPR